MQTRNTDHGFFGTMALKGRDAAQAWSIALPLIQAAANASAEAVRDYLDATHGRHFADEVANQMARGLGLETAIRAAVDIHMGWLIDTSTTRAHGIPAGLPHLVGWVRHFEALAEADSKKGALNERAIKALLAEIAKEHLFIETLERRWSDSKDFHDLPVYAIERALRAAFEAGAGRG